VPALERRPCGHGWFVHQPNISASTVAAGTRLRHDPDSMPLSLLIVDDHAGFRGSAERLFREHGFDVTGAAEDGESALEEVRRLRPDVVLLDVQLPGIDGFEVALSLSRQMFAPRVVLTSSRDATDYGERLRRAPVLGFIPKHELSGPALAAMVGER
jgi:DNA-binding NarL/FixJ family response regulator